MQVRVYVTPREGVLDPQGKAVEHSLASLGFRGVSGVRIGKYIQLEIDAATRDQAVEAAGRMCQQLLANPLIEDYSFEVVDGGQNASAGSALAAADTGVRHKD